MRRASRPDVAGQATSTTPDPRGLLLLAAGAGVAAGVLAGVLAGGSWTSQVLVGVAVAGLAAAPCGTALLRMRRALRRLHAIDRGVAAFAARSADGPVEAAVAAAVGELLSHGELVELHLGATTPSPQGLSGVVAADALATGRPAVVPAGTSGRETARLLALPLTLGERRIGAAVLRVPRGTDQAVPDVQVLLDRVAPALAAAAPQEHRAGTPPPPDALQVQASLPSMPALPPPSPPSPSSPRPGPVVAGGAAPSPGAGAGTRDGTGATPADADLRDLVARGAHDLRTPLNTLAGMVDTLVRHGEDLPPGGRDQLHAALQRSTRRIAGWITMLLDTAVDREERSTDPVRTSLQPLLEEAVAVSHAATAGLEVYLAPTELEVLADPGSVVRTVANLLANAGHHASNGNTVEIEARPRGELVEVCVRDHGDGWDEATTSRRAATPGGPDHTSGPVHTSGLGLGLASVRAQVGTWGGDVELGDTPGGGATVRFTVPRAEPVDGNGHDPRGDGQLKDAGRQDDQRHDDQREDDGGRDLTWTIAGGESLIPRPWGAREHSS